MLYTILLSFMILVCVLMVAVILAQRSEGGALGIGSGPSGFMTARGAGNFLTRSTWILGSLFFVCAVALIVVGNIDRKGSDLLLQPNAVKPLAPTAPTPSAAPAARPAAPPPAAAKPDLGDLEAPASSSTPSAAPPPATLKAPAKPASKP